MNIYNFRNTNYSKLKDQLIYIDFKMLSDHYIHYVWEHPTTKDRYEYKTSNPIEIIIMTEIKYNKTVTVNACLSNPVAPYCNNQVGIQATFNLLDKDSDASQSLKLFLSMSFRHIPPYCTNIFPKCNNISYLPNNNPIEQPNNMEIQLYNYQRNTVSKMINIENNVSMTINYKYDIKFGEGTIKYDPIKKVQLFDDNDNDYKFKVSTKGGILADQMGLGKTITALTLIMLNPSKLNYDLDYTDVTKYVNITTKKIETKATLISCPAHLTKQWESEINKVFKTAKIIKLVDKRSHQHLKYKDIIDADIVIISQQFLMNFKYYPTINYRQCTASNYCRIERASELDKILSNWVSNKVDIYNKEQPNIEHFNFHRLVVDEGHEIFGLQLSNNSVSNYMSDWLSGCSSNFKWFISGTPFVSYSGLVNCLKFIDCKVFYDNQWKKYSEEINMGYNNCSIFSKKYIIDDLLKSIMIRHRKEDTTVDILGYDEEHVWVELTDFEKKIYESKESYSNVSTCEKRLMLQQLCCHILATDTIGQMFSNKEVNLSDIEDKLIIHNKNQITTYQDKLKELVTTSPEYHMLKKVYETKISEATYFLKIIEKISSTDDLEDDENCSVCLDEIENRVITKCGHMFCKDCLDSCLKYKKSCPYCKFDLKNSDIYLTDKMASKKEENGNNPLIQKYGSKLGKLISIARQLVINENNKIIIFSQWDRMLNLIGSALKENGVSNSFIKGNTHHRNAAINKFKMDNDENNVIMLSLEKSASGTNLTEATHILFVEPIDSTIDQVKAIEAQAIARACRLGQVHKVKLIRILTKDTIEEEIYDKIYKNNSDVNDLTNGLEDLEIDV